MIEKLPLVVFHVSVGAAERTRTFDLLINSQSHYRAMQQRQTIVLLPLSVSLNYLSLVISKGGLFYLPHFMFSYRGEAFVEFLQDITVPFA